MPTSLPPGDIRITTTLPPPQEEADEWRTSTTSDGRIVYTTIVEEHNHYITNPTTIIRESSGGGTGGGSDGVSRDLFRRQIEVVFENFAESLDSLREDLAEAFTTAVLTVSGNASIGGNLNVVGTLTAGTLNVSSLASSGAVEAPYFTATTTSTSTLPTLASTVFGFGSDYFTDLTGTGLQNVGGVLTLNATGDWTGMFDGQESLYYLSRANHTGTQLASTISDFDSATNVYIHASTTIPKTYSSNTFTTNQTFSSIIYSTNQTSNAIHTRFIAGAANGSTSDGPLYLQYGKSQNLYLGDGSSSSNFIIQKGDLTLSSGLITQTGAGNNTFAGNVGVGTTSPAAKLSISNYSSGASTMPLLLIASSTGSGATSTPFIIDSLGRVGIGTTTITSTSHTLTVGGVLKVDNGLGWTALQGGTNNSFQGIMPSGSYYFGKTFDSGNSGLLNYDSTGGYFTISNNNSTLDNGVRISDNLRIEGSVIRASALANDSTGYYVCLNTTTGQMATSTTACGASSERFKKNIENISYGLDAVNALRPVSFDYKDSYIPNAPPQLGFIAEEVELVIPELVAKDAHGTIQGLDYPKFGAVIVRAIQELYDMVAGFAHSITSENVNATQRLCVGQTCITESELIELLDEADQQPAPSAPVVEEPEEPIEPPVEETPDETIEEPEIVEEQPEEESAPEPEPEQEPAPDPVSP